MPKFSIIVPVYNVEKYIKRCLDSIFEQSYDDYEVIVVNDGTPDNSMDIVKKYNVKIINQKNKGLSEARNIGVKKAKGEYIIFVDSDDYIEKDLLKNINKNLSNNPDIVRYQAIDVINDNKKEYHEKEFAECDGAKAFELITQYHYVEPAWLYAIKKDYYIKNKFEFKKGAYHEDFGLIPLIIIKSSKVNSIDYCGYYYVQRNNSIMTDLSYEKKIKKIEDVLNHYDYLIKESRKINKDLSYFKSFISNQVILKVTELNKKDYKKYIKILKDKHVFDGVLSNSLKRKVKKSILKLSPKLYYKIEGNIKKWKR